MSGTVVHFRSDFARPSERFVTAPLPYFRSWRPVLLGWRGPTGVPGVAPSSCMFYEDLPARGFLTSASWRLGHHPKLAISWLGQRGARLCHAHFGEDGALVLPLARRLKMPLLVSFYGHDLTRLPTWRTTRPAWLHYWMTFDRLRREAAVALPNCRFLATRLAELGWPAERVRVVYPGVTLPQEALWRPHNRLVLAVGRLVEKKGFETLIDAARVLRDGGLEVAVAILGDGPLRRPLEALVERNRLSGTVTLPGWVSPTGLRAWFESAAMLVAPSNRSTDGDMEGLPTVLIEAAALGMPLVGTRHAGIPEIVLDGETGLLVPEREPGALAAAIGALLENDDRRAQFSSGARQLVTTQFMIQQQATTLEQLYDQVAESAA